ncbi:hypothetical protein PsYK624_165750 [Phanerochaete sordida]|uniref:Uncharacterized protein n=1 Tax=Phanerochaete sordida TaxID=48140 RepID=A0A9P3GWM2_9APHY|nr:hypothetical protein PsYK624_165750 [Phanerochaete sordida]
MNAPPAVPPSSLLCLPTELLLVVQDYFEPSDLVTHVAYYQLHARTRACYATANRTGFWENLLYDNGLRPLSSDIDHSDPAWRQAAFDIAAHAHACAHPACGQERLARNRAQIQAKLNSWDPDDWDGSCILDSREANFAGLIECNEIFACIGFNNSFPRHDINTETLKILIGRCAFLRATPEADDGWRTADLLERHPIILHSFATFPPIDWLRMFHAFVDGEDVDAEATNYDGVTVQDALTSLGTLLEKGLTQNKIDDLIAHVPWEYTDDRNNPFPKSWSPQDRVLAAHRVGHWFQVTRWKGFDFDVIDDTGMVAFVACEAKPLPDRAQTHIDKYAHPRMD